MAKRRRRKQRQNLTAGERRQLSVSIESLEVVRGHDGLLRGKPEPALLLAAYRVSSSASLVGRLLRRVGVSSAPPCVLNVQGAELRYDTRLRESERFVLLGLAVEEDSGEGVSALYAALESPRTFELWSTTEPVPAPRALPLWSQVAHQPPEAVPIELLLDARHARDLGERDDFISACAMSLNASERHDELWRLPFADGTGRNQWTATLRVRIA